MQDQDWQIPERLNRIRRSYLAQGFVGRAQLHYLTTPQMGPLNPGRPLVRRSPIVAVQAPSDGPFVWFGQSAYLLVQDGTQGQDLTLNYPIMIAIQREKTDKQLVRGRPDTGAGLLPDGVLDDSWRPLGDVFGTGQRPHFWPFPVYLMRRDRILFQALYEQSNRFAARVNVLRLTLYGFRLVPLKAPPNK